MQKTEQRTKMDESSQSKGTGDRGAYHFWDQTSQSCFLRFIALEDNT